MTVQCILAPWNTLLLHIILLIHKQTRRYRSILHIILKKLSKASESCEISVLEGDIWLRARKEPSCGDGLDKTWDKVRASLRDVSVKEEPVASRVGRWIEIKDQGSRIKNQELIVRYSCLISLLQDFDLKELLSHTACCSWIGLPTCESLREKNKHKKFDDEIIVMPPYIPLIQLVSDHKIIEDIQDL